MKCDTCNHKVDVPSDPYPGDTTICNADHWDGDDGLPYVGEDPWKDCTDYASVEPRTCGNCNVSAGDECGHSGDKCMDWQPVTVATTDAKTELQNAIYKYTGQKPDEYPTKQETEDAYVYLAKKGLVVDQKYHGYMLAMHEAIAKRNDLIRRMAEWMEKADNETQFWMKGKPNNLGDYRNLISEADELMGVK